MSWQGIEGHDDNVQRFRRAIASNRLASTFLFVGPPGIGKRAFALKLAQSLLCQRIDPVELNPCGHCDACIQVTAGTHPDLILVSKPAEKSAIPVAALVGDDNRRMREGLCHDISLKAFMGGRKVAIIDDADYLNEEGANCLLKTLEEPPPYSVLILIGTTPDKQLPTIRSRCQTIRFQPLETDVVAELLESRGLVGDPAEARRLAAISGGSLERALELAAEELWTFRRQLLAALVKRPLPSVELAQATVAFVDAAGKEAPARRARARQLIAFTAEFYGQLLRALAGGAARGDADLVAAVNAAQRIGGFSEEGVMAAVDRSLEALAHVDRNAHQATLIECWLDDLARILETNQPVAEYAG
ncbi:MAG TPA: DNA polymerase III subunit [Pirellulales bacterium]|jgi:DNA polymerase-3 subunit delta'|nr:DNA polymerase III subunit [Pirellulales bacterium]